MCYKKLADEYFDEAQKLGLHIKNIKKCYGRSISIEDDREMYYRVKILYSMYLELRYVGEYLTRKAWRNENNDETNWI